jgi:hypothetical protein
MKPQELRIGDYFEVRSSYDGSLQTVMITEIGKKQVHTNNKWVNTDQLIPIEITEHILANAGFTRLDWLKNAAVFQGKHFKCVLDVNGMSLFCDDLKISKPVKYLHGLQNIFIDLTGEELELHINNVKPIQKEIA